MRGSPGAESQKPDSWLSGDTLYPYKGLVSGGNLRLTDLIWPPVPQTGRGGRKRRCWKDEVAFTAHTNLSSNSEQQKNSRHVKGKKCWPEPTGKHSVEVGAAGCQHHFVCLDFFVGDMEHDVAQQAALSHPVHGYEGVMVVPLWVVRDAVAVAVEQLHAPFHHGAWCCGRGLLPGPHSGQLKDAEKTFSRQLIIPM